MGTPAEEYKPRMTKMAFCPSFEEEEDWSVDEEEDQDGNNNVNDTLGKDQKVANASITEVDNICSKDEEKAKVSIPEVDSTCSKDEKGAKVSVSKVDIICSKDEETAKVSISEVANVNEDEDGYYEVEGIAMDLDNIFEYPTMKDIEFETSCGTCEKQVGPPVNCCSAGHVICDSCLEAGQTSCGADIVVSKECRKNVVTKKCLCRFVGIDAVIQNTPYYKEFMKSCHYECGLKPLGCDAVLSGLEIVQHELLQCAFRFVKYCEFRRGGCTSTFDNLKENFQHLVEKHDLPTEWNSDEAHFNVRFNPEKHSEMNGYLFRDIPFIQAAVGTSDKQFLCLLMTENLEDDKTRLWFLKVFCENENHFTVVVRIYPPGGEDSLKGTVTMQLAVVSEIREVNNLTEKPADGRKYYVDLDNKMLGKYLFKKNENHYFGLLVVMVEHTRKPEPISRTFKSILQKYKDELGEKEKLRDSLEAIPILESYDDIGELDEESERLDELKVVRGEIYDLKNMIKYWEEQEKNSEAK